MNTNPQQWKEETIKMLEGMKKPNICPHDYKNTQCFCDPPEEKDEGHNKALSSAILKLKEN